MIKTLLTNIYFDWVYDSCVFYEETALTYNNPDMEYIMLKLPSFFIK